jgi:GT2 family glycosyltransferase/glycosyltransferase involved in cell wall biosynthesis
MPPAPARPLRRICAITPVFNRRDLTLDCLRTLFESDLEGLDLHCIVVDDGSSDGTAAAIAEAYPQVEIITGDGTLWYSEGTNVGICSALKRSPDYMLLYNNDSRFPPEALQKLVACAERHASSLVGGVLIDWDHPDRIFQVGTQWQTGHGGWRTWSRQTVADLPDGPFAVETIVGNCMLVPAQAIRECGLMKSREMPNFGDAELSARMRKSGWRLLIDPSVRILCQPNDLPKRLSSMTPRQVYDALWARRTSYHNLRQKAATNAGGAPSRLQGGLATAIYVARLALKPLGLMGRWPNDLPEKPLRDFIAPLPDPAQVAPGGGRLIAYAWPYVEWGGVQVYMINLMKEVKAAGYRVAALLPESTDAIHLAELGKIAEVWTFDDAQDLKPATGLLRRIERRQRTRQAENAFAEALFAKAPTGCLVHIDAAPWTSASLFRRILTRHRLVLTLHTGLPKMSFWRRRLWSKNLTAVMNHPSFRLIATNGEACRSLAPFVSPKLRDGVQISPSSFDPDRIAEAQVRRRSVDYTTRLGLGPAGFRIVVGAQFIARKGYGDLLEALRMLLDEGRPVACLWIAPAPPHDEERAVLEKAEYRGLLDLRFQKDVGGTSDDYLAAVAQLADCFVLASHVEGLPLALVEAMAMGVPCIATNINGVPEAILHGRTGLLIPPHAPRELADAIAMLAKDQALRHELGATAKADMQVRYSLPVVSRSTLAVYGNLQCAKDLPCAPW